MKVRLTLAVFAAVGSLVVGVSSGSAHALTNSYIYTQPGHPTAVALCQCASASDRKVRSVDRETR